MKHNPAQAFLQENQRLSRKQAKATARVIAAATYDTDSDGKLVRVADQKAVGLLERAFTQLFLRRGKPFSMQISASEAAAFPSHVPVAGGSYALAVGFDVETRATFSMAGAAAVCGDRPVEAADIARHIAMAGLARGMQSAGIPARGRA
ncbi:hypothetical protein [Paracoccus sp. (in: a-proteobacteria)]|uniref:hypothetical protein n=1 Tax=Paracoccus sp. TaxID=267 RepID=UPI0035B3BC90